MPDDFKICLVVKPDWRVATDDFPEKWSHFLSMRETLLRDDVEKTTVMDDKSVAFVTSEASRAVDAALMVQNALREQMGPGDCPVKMVIDSLPDSQDEQVVVERLDVHWEDIGAGEVYLSSFAHKLIGKRQELALDPSPEAYPEKRFYRVVFHANEKKGTAVLFSHHGALTEGKHPPCYYCGARVHETADCPSKHLPYGMQALEKLGYLSLDLINKAFSDYLCRRNPADEAPKNPLDTGMDNPLVLAHHGFFELKSVFQLPFFKNFWNARDEDWEKVRQTRSKKEEKGGVIWMGTDCLRVSNLDQATAFLQASLEKYPDDYRPYCALGFLNVEKNEFLTARSCFLKALERAVTKPQKIFTLFLISRLYDLEGYPTEAVEKIREILALDHDCGEAIYQDVLFRFRDGKHSDALSRLTHLIERDRQFYIYALIDPDLGPYSTVVHPELRKIFVRVKEQATAVFNEAKKEFQKSELLLGKKETEEARSLWARLTNLHRNDSFFGYLDMIHYSKALMVTSLKSVEERRRMLFEDLHTLRRRVTRFLGYVHAYRFKNLVGGVYRDLMSVERKIGETKEMANSDVPERFKESFEQPSELSASLDRIAAKLGRLESVQLAAFFLTRFVKINLVCLSMVVILATVLFPVTIHYLNLVLPKYSIDPVHNIWRYQQAILIIGGVCGTLVAFIKTIQGLHKEQGHSY